MLIIAIPSYAVAFMTEKVFYVVPTIAMMMIIANSIEQGNVTNRNRVDEDAQSVDEGLSEGINEGEGGV
jgi:hypothetical protein